MVQVLSRIRWLSRRCTKLSGSRMLRSFIRNARLYFLWIRLWRCLPVRDWIRAAEEYSKGNYRLSSVLYSRALAKKQTHPASACAKLDLAHCYYKLGEKDKVVSLLMPVVASSVELPQAYILLSKVLLQLGRSRLALSVSAEARRIFPNAADVLAAHIFSRMQVFDTSPESTAALDADVVVAYAMLERGDIPCDYCYENLQVPGSLLYPISIDKRVKQEVPNNCSSGVDVSSNRIITLEDIISLKTAVAWYEHVYGDPYKAEFLLAEAVSLGADSVELFLLLSDRQLEDGHISNARSMLCEAVYSDSCDPRPLGALAKTYIRSYEPLSGRATEIGAGSPETWALEFALKACQQSLWGNFDYLIILKQAYEICGDFDSAALMTLRIERLAISGKLNFGTVKFALSNLEDLQKSDVVNQKIRELH